MRRSWPIILVLLTCYFSARAQVSSNADSAWINEDPVFAEFDSLLNSSDSLSILGLIDSLLNMKPLRSQVAFRLGYNSNVSETSRSLSINKFGLSPGVSYYHKSGAYADASVYWSDEYDPAIYLSIGSLGYLTSITKHWSLLAEYSHYFYSYTDTSTFKYFDRTTSTYTSYRPNTPYTDNLQVANYLDAGKFTFRLDYSFLFGQQTAHRLSPVAGLNLTKRKLWIFDRVSFFPSVNLMYGSEVLPGKTVITYEPITTRPIEIIYRYRNGLPLFAPRQTITPEKTVWGIMNYAVNIPVTVAVKKWSLLVGYSYNFPQVLPGEDLESTDGGFLSLSVMYVMGPR